MRNMSPKARSASPTRMDLRPAVLLAASLSLGLQALPARAGSVTADSINDRTGALQAAMEQMPKGATVTKQQCEEIQVGGFNLPRHRCTVWYTDPPAAGPSSPTGSGSSQP